MVRCETGQSILREHKTLNVLLMSRRSTGHFFSFSMKPTAHSFPYLFLYKALHVSGSSSTHHQELVTVHSALAHVIQV